MCFRKEPPKLKDFDTLADLDAWCDLHKELRMDAPNLCDDYSSESQRLAETDGYFLSMCLVYDGKAYGVEIFPDAEDVYHVGNMAKVMNPPMLYYVDLAWGKLIHLCNLYQGGKY